jgi:hypothetical protein
MKNIEMQCDVVLWRREVAGNDVEAEGEEGGTYDLTSLKVFRGCFGLPSCRSYRVVEIAELSSLLKWN